MILIFVSMNLTAFSNSALQSRDRADAVMPGRTAAVTVSVIQSTDAYMLFCLSEAFPMAAMREKSEAYPLKLHPLSSQSRLPISSWKLPGLGKNLLS